MYRIQNILPQNYRDQNYLCLLRTRLTKQETKNGSSLFSLSIRDVSIGRADTTLAMCVSTAYSIAVMTSYNPSVTGALLGPPSHVDKSFRPAHVCMLGTVHLCIKCV